MTIKKMWCLLVLAVVLLPVKGFPEVTSRIQGNIHDMSTGEPIWGATVILLYCERYEDICDKKDETFTDSKGFFQFHFLKKGLYRLLVYKDGYADFGPFFKAELENIVNGKGRRSNPSLLGLSVVIEAFEKEKIYLQEGEIKHVTIELKKEAILEIRFKRKTKDGIEPLYYELFPGRKTISNFGAMVSIIDYGNETAHLIPSKKDIGIMIFKGLPPGQVIHGVLTDKNSGKPLIGARISFYNIAVERQSCHVYTNFNGEYWLGGFIPGKYMMNITPSGGEKVRMQLDIKENQKLEINREL
jgi:hypothetical protein